MSCTLFNVVFASDKHYLPYLDIALKSLLAHHHNTQVFVMHIGDIPADWAAQRRPYFEARQCSLHLVTLAKDDFNSLNLYGHVSTTGYLRYAIEELFPHSDSPNWLYLDCDLVVNGNLIEPFLLPEFANVPLAAVADPGIVLSDPNANPTPHYFNSGVMYINANHWHNIKSSLINTTIQHKDKLRLGDQDVLNLHFQHNYLPLSIDYNYQHRHLFAGCIPKDGAKIIHYTGKIKPLEVKSISSSLIKTIILFRFYHGLDWQNIIDFPEGFFCFNLYQN